ncbi:hypothetical protein A45J_1723 [hot springs metagenome]|uniref:Response regulatory domain-containing protein n=1 Tax=hot springs metagenome TaxID=433727 RepID=A0A5J4L171_9ZZZZ
MDTLAELKKITQNCTVMCVEDDDSVLSLLHEALSGLFKHVITAKNGQDGIDKFHKNKIDLLITDNIMPVMNGIDMIKEIKKTEPKLPIILITAHTDTDILMEAINIGVTQFIAKPFTINILFNAIETAIQRIIVEKQKMLYQETELLKYKESYNILQQKLALKKQHNIIKNDLYYKKLLIYNDTKASEWLINIRYEPHDILSGDFYSIRKIAKDKIIIYLSDAMGKGLNAFISNAVITSFLNFSIDKALKKNDFDKERFFNDFFYFSKQYLSEDEALCAVLLFIDFEKNSLEIANFSMPPILIETEKRELLKISSNNPPIMRFAERFKKDIYNIESLEKMLICSDGIYNEKYCDYIENDFINAAFKNQFFKRFTERTITPDDDITFIFIKKIQYIPKWTKTYSIKSRLEDVQSIVTEIEVFLMEMGMDAVFIAECITAVSEMTMNAYEHGSLNITYQQKNRLIKEGKYEEYLLDLEKQIDKKIAITIELFENYNSLFICFKITDEGHGFDTSIIKETMQDINLLHYRGIKIVKGIVDEIYYNNSGNEVILLKECSER